ncbi:MAG TPA: hypothetical protein ENH02_04870 [Bacteroidetes bacterium]|nr:hypothetical protein [Bacteroidota bacterium]
MLKKVLIIFIAVIAFTGCKKQNNQVLVKQSLVFVGQGISADHTKAVNTDCDNPGADYAVVVIDGISYRPYVFYIGGTPFTEVIKLFPGSYHVDEFLLMNDSGTPGFLDDDIIVEAVPEVGSEYARFVTSPVSFEITVAEYGKTEIPVEVICFDENEFDSFGFDWFTMTEITVRSQNISGSLCVENPDDYGGSLYEGQSNGLQNQMPAIFRIDVYRNGAFLLSYNNEDWLGETDPLDLKYPDLDNASDHFDFELYVLVKSCGGFYYKQLETWSFDDDSKLVTGDDEVVDFVVGDCTTGDYQIPEYLYLPEQSKFKVKDFGPGTLGTFVDIRLTQIPDGYLIEKGIYPGWNGEHSTIDYNNQYNDEAYIVNIYSSLCSNLPDPVSFENKNWPAVNWLINHLDQYPGYQWDDLQAAFWLILDQDPEWDGEGLFGVRPLSDLQFARQMHDDAINDGTGFVPEDGDLYAIIFLKSNAEGRSGNPVVHVRFIE